MQDLLIEINDKILTITFNKVEVHNAFDENLLIMLEQVLNEASQNPDVQVIILKGNGKNFSSGADLNWMKRMALYSEEENIKDALILAKAIYALYSIKKPTITIAHGATYGGGLGLIAASDIAIASNSAKFCFSEVKLGLIPAVISPYIIRAIGERQANRLFMSADLFDAKIALEIGLIHHRVDDDELLYFAMEYAQKLIHLPNNAVISAKYLVKTVANCEIDAKMQLLTAELIAKKRATPEAQLAIAKFLNKGLK
jgi:methylglutaconyl-CoA hydratase